MYSIKKDKNINDELNTSTQRYFLHRSYQTILVMLFRTLYFKALR